LSFGRVEVDIVPSEGRKGRIHCKLNKVLYGMVSVRFLDIWGLGVLVVLFCAKGCIARILV